MSDIKLFKVTNNSTSEILGKASYLEKPLQNLIESNLGSLLGIRLIATEHSTGKTHGGRIDTLGLDENNCPVIIEYKRSSHQNIITQGLFYLDWLMDHQAEFKLLVLEKHGTQSADAIDWSGPRLICIAADFTKYDSHAVQQMDRNIELLRYRQFGKELLLLELANAVATGSIAKKNNSLKNTGPDKTVNQWLLGLTPAMRTLFDSLDGYITSLGDDVQRKDLKLYVAFKRLRNFITVCFQKNNLLVYLHVDPTNMKLVDGFSRNVSAIGHWGSGDLELTIRTMNDFETAKPFFALAYEGGSSAN